MARHKRPLFNSRNDVPTLTYTQAVAEIPEGSPYYAKQFDEKKYWILSFLKLLKMAEKKNWKDIPIFTVVNAPVPAYNLREQLSHSPNLPNGFNLCDCLIAAYSKRKVLEKLSLTQRLQHLSIMSRIDESVSTHYYIYNFYRTDRTSVRFQVTMKSDSSKANLKKTLEKAYERFLHDLVLSRYTIALAKNQSEERKIKDRSYRPQGYVMLTAEQSDRIEVLGRENLRHQRLIDLLNSSKPSGVPLFDTFVRPRPCIRHDFIYVYSVAPELLKEFAGSRFAAYDEDGEIIKGASPFRIENVPYNRHRVVIA